jgi:ADP-ribose pyrophosphatase
VGAVVFHKGSVLLVRRKNPPARGKWSVPGGKVRPGETLAGAAQRETLEETGILVEPGPPVHVFDVIHRRPDGSLRFHYIIVDLLAARAGGTLKAGDDAEDARWVPVEDLDSLDVEPATRELVLRLVAEGRAAV